MSRHRNLVNQIHDAEEEEYEDNYGDEDFDEEAFIYEILDVIGSDFEYNEVQSVLEKFNYDQERIIDHFLKNKENILARKKKSEAEKSKPKPIEKKVQNNPKEDKSVQRKVSSQEEDFKSSMEKVQKTIDISKFNTPFPVIKYDYKSLSDSKQHHLNLVIVGHVDAGKSTLTGHLMYLMKEIDDTVMHKFEKESKISKMSSFKYAWALDETQEERSRGVTIDTGIKTIRTRSKLITFLDAPGHRDFIPNMINGASQADAAILVIDSNINAFEAGFERGGQTREHAYLIKALGVQQTVVVLNKMDMVNWSKERYDNIVEAIKNYFVINLGFDEDKLFFVPVSSFLGINIVDSKNVPKEGQWYNGSCLVEIIDKLNVPPKEINKPLRISITNAYQSNVGKLKGFCVSGKIESGVLLNKKNYMLLPSATLFAVKGKEIYYLFKILEILLNESEKVQGAEVGENVDILIQLQNAYDAENFHPGDVLSSIEYPAAFSKNFLVEIVTSDLDYPILKGMQIMIHINKAKSSAIVKKLEKIIDRSNGQLIKKLPKCLKSNECALIEISTEIPLCLELFSNLKSLGRIILREKFKTLASGMVVKIL